MKYRAIRTCCDGIKILMIINDFQHPDFRCAFFFSLPDMPGNTIQYLFIILAIVALNMIANKLKVAYPIVLVIGGLVLGFTALFGDVTIEPELVFLIFLPPLLYEAAWQVSWKEFWKWRRVIMSFAFPIVILTSCVVAFVSSALIPGFTLALGFLLGGIVSPPDAISATTIMRNLSVPKPLMRIIEGESLLNDASSLIVFRFALAAIITGQFYFQEAVTSFFLVIIVGILIGLAVGAVFYVVHRWLPSNTSIEIVLTLVTPYCMYYSAEYFHFSGVLAVVSGGLFLSSQRQRMLNYRSRIEGSNVWTSFVFLLNGIIFFLIGLQLPFLVEQLGDISLGMAIFYGLFISVVLIVTRLICTLGGSVFTRVMSRFITVADANPGWKGPFVAGWAGMRGVVSLAAALSIPLAIGAGEPFPHRSLILFITFIVILVTLVFQGLTLPWVIRKLNMEDRHTLIPEEKQEKHIRQKIAKVSLLYLEENYAKELRHNALLKNLYERKKIDLADTAVGLSEEMNNQEIHRDNFSHIYLEVLEQQRKALNRMNQLSEFEEDLIRKYLALIDLEEFKIRERQIPEELM